MSGRFSLNRRGFLASSGAGLAALSMPRPSWAQSFPSRPFNVTVPTSEGGGAERDSRAFTGVWGNHIGGTFEYGFYPGASGQVGYEHYMQRVERDPHNLLSSFIGPEVIMLTLQAPHINPVEDLIYFQQWVDQPMCLYVGADSPIESIEQLVDIGRQRTISVSTSRLPHPASITALSLAEETGADFNLIPFGGGNDATMAAITGEVDVCSLPIALPITMGDQVRILCVFEDENPVPDATNNAPTANAALGTNVPNVTSARAWVIHRETAERFPEEFELIKTTMREALSDPAFEEAMGAVGVLPEFIHVGGEEVAQESVRVTAELAERFRDLLTGS